MWKEAVKKAAYLVAPSWAKRSDLRRWNVRLGQAFRDRLSACPTLGDKVDLVLNDHKYNSGQKRSEILGLAERVLGMSPRRLCEIGTRDGGTLALFAQVAAPDARVLSLDIQYAGEKALAYPGFARDGQRITLLEADSHREETLASVRGWLGGASLDFLFIDGDHSFDGVVRDFAMYAPLVRAGGLIAFHDIVPDSFTRSGVRTVHSAGEVPRFWNDLKGKGYSVEELIEDPEQDGMGIGLVRWDGGHR